MSKAEPAQTVTLTSREDVRTFESRKLSDDEARAVFGEDMWRELHDGPSIRRGTVTVTSIDRAAGELTFGPSTAVYAGPLGALRPVRP